ncbi:hypothetical protein [Cyclobacterium lianum]|uniref:hypothetical protein n=1 Tax=Cyclobacterium lianum TaxID=388280 RepID=UPI0011601853|nr:hypothetical protein [Cyclobacterium lianum]
MEQKRPLPTKLAAYALLLLMVIAIGSLIFGYKGIALLVALLVVINTLIFPFLKPITFFGNLHLLPDQIVFEKEQADNDRLIFPVAEIHKINISLNGYKGEMYSNPRTLFPKDGIGNKITLQHKDHVYKFELLLEKKDISVLSYFINKWENLNIPVTVLNKWGRESKL